MSVIQRLLPSRKWLEGRGLRILLWSVLGALLTGALMFCAAISIDLLASHGSVKTTRAQLERLQAQFPGLAIPGAPIDSTAAAPPHEEASNPQNVDEDAPVDEHAPAEAPVAKDEAGDDDSAEHGNDAENRKQEAFLLEDQGLVATLLRYQDRRLDWPLGLLCRRFPLLADTRFASLAVLLTFVLLWLLQRVAQSRIHRGAILMGLHTTNGVRQSLHRQALRLTPGDLDGGGTRRAVELFTETIGRIDQAIVLCVSRLPIESLTSVVLLAVALTLDPRLTLQCAIPVLTSWWMFSHEQSRLRHLSRLSTSRADSDLRRLSEGLLKSRLVRGYGMEDFERQRFGQYLEHYARELTRFRSRDWWSIWAARACLVLCVLLVVFFVSSRVMSAVHPLPFSLAVLLVAIFARMTVAAMRLVSLSEARQTLQVEGEKVYRYLDEIPEVGQAVGAKFLHPVSKSIIFESVAYKLNGRPLLKDLDLRLTAGQSTAVVSLDATVCRAIGYLLPRFIEPQSGRVLFDSEDTAWATLESLRAETVYVGGDDPFFTGTVLENLTCGDSRFTPSEAADAAKAAHAHNFVVKLPQGYETVIGEHGEQLEPGQAFRLSLGRAILRNPAVLIVEEPRDPLDNDTKALLDDAYNRLVKGRTVLFLPSRLSTVRRCDQVALIHEGRVAAIGTHETLVKQSELYRHWEYLKFSALPLQTADG